MRFYPAGSIPTYLGSGFINVAIARRLLCLASIMLCMMAMPMAAHAQDESDDAESTSSSDARTAAVIRGYHGYNAPLMQQALMPQGVLSEDLGKWLPTSEYKNYAAVVIDGRLEQGKIDPAQYTEEDRQHVMDYLNEGGSLIILYQGRNVFTSEAGKALLTAITGQANKPTPAQPSIGDHPFVKHLQGQDFPAWAKGSAMGFVEGDGALLTSQGYALVYHKQVGPGHFVYMGWDMFRNKPSGRSKSVTPEQEQAWQDQTQILYHIAQALFPLPPSGRNPRTFFDNPYELTAADTRDIKPIADPGNLSHRLVRPLPVASSRAMGKGPAKFVDPARGDDTQPGSETQPWRTLAFAIKQLQPGDTLYLRGGVYHEKVTLNLQGTAEAPITLRAYPKELPMLDGGIPVFLHDPAQAWRPAADGVEGEYESVATYPGLNIGSPALMGHFADTMIPLMGYRFRKDLQSDNPYWNLKQNQSDEQSLYSGPGVWFNPDTQRIHIRLAHTKLPGEHNENYQGPTDPRQVPLVISHSKGGGTLLLTTSQHIHLQDLVIRGSRATPLQILASADITLDGLSVYGGGSCVSVSYTQGLRMVHCVVRGQSAPWVYRSSLKYRSTESRLFSAGSWMPLNNGDFDLAYNEFTDSVDGVFIGNVDFIRFHHNLLDNCSDDGLFLTATADNLGQMHGGPILIYQNLFARCLQAFAYGVGHGRQPVTDTGVLTGKGLWVYRNVFDLRGPVPYFQPRDADDVEPAFGRSQVDHGNPVWEPMIYYHNTLVSQGPAFRSGYLNGWGGFMRTPARVLLNNIVVQQDKPVGAVFMPGAQNLLYDSNLHWSISEGAADAEKFVARINTSLGHILRKITPETPAASPILYDDEPMTDAIADLLPDAQQRRTPLVLKGQNDLYADPQLAAIPENWRLPLDVRLPSSSPAVDKGMPLPQRWPDPLREADAGQPDLGAVPVGSDGWRFGAHGRMTISSGKPQ